MGAEQSRYKIQNLEGGETSEDTSITDKQRIESLPVFQKTKFEEMMENFKITKPVSENAEKFQQQETTGQFQDEVQIQEAEETPELLSVSSLVDAQKIEEHDLKMSSLKAELEAAKEAVRRTKENGIAKPVSENGKKLRELSEKLNFEKVQKEKEARRIANMKAAKHMYEIQAKTREVEKNLKLVESERDAARASTRQRAIENMLENSKSDGQKASSLDKNAIFEKIEVLIVMLSSDLEPVQTAVMLAVEIDQLGLATSKKTMALASLSRMNNNLDEIIDNGVKAARISFGDSNGQTRINLLFDIQKCVSDMFRCIEDLKGLWEIEETDGDWLTDLAESVQSADQKRLEIEQLWKDFTVAAD